MVNVLPEQNSFNAGEWSPHLWGRQTGVDAYDNSCREITNFEVLVQGPARFRSGYRYIRREPSTTLNAKASRFIRFEFGTTQSYVIEFCDQFLRFYRDRAALTETAKVITAATAANPAVITSAAHGYSNGDEVFISGVVGMAELNNRYFLIGNVTTDTFELTGIDSSAYTAYTSGGTVARVYKIASPYTEAQIWDIGFTQSADEIYLVHPNVIPKKLVRDGDTNWSFSDYVLKDGPYKDTNTTTTTLTPSGTSGTVTITASSIVGINNGTGFQATDVGRVIRIKHSSTWGWGRITVVGSTTSVTLVTSSNFGGTGASVDWRLGAFSNTDGWPSVVTFFQDRLVFIEAAGEPQGVFLSRTSRYDDFAPSDAAGDVFAFSAISVYLASNTVNKAHWAVQLGRDLVIGTSSSEWTLGANTSGEALTATTAVARETTTFGSAKVQALKINNTALFAGATQQSVGRIAYSFEIDNLAANDVNLFSNHIIRGNIRQLAYAREPENRLFLVTQDGKLLTMSYKPEENVFGWTRVRTDGIVKSVACIPDPVDGRNELYVLVEREIDGVKYKFTEVQDDPFDIGESVENAHFLDAAVKYDGRSQPAASLTISAATGDVTITASGSVFGSAAVDDDIRIGVNIARITAVNSATEVEATVLSDYTMPLTAISGDWDLLLRITELDRLWHLEGATVSILADGATHPDRTVANGKITLDDKYHVVHVGLPYQGRIVTRMFNEGSRIGTAQGTLKRFHKAIIHFLDTMGGWIGVTNYSLTNTSDMLELQFRSVDDRMDQTLGTKSGFFEEAWPGGYEREGSLVIEQRQPLPMTIIAVIPKMHTYEGT